MTLLWLELMLFMLAVGLLALYGLTFSGHFPSEFRAPDLKTAAGTIVLWATLAAACLAAIIALGVALPVLPWSVIIISAGAILLATPLLLRPFPDRFVNARAALIAFAAGAVLAALGMLAVKQLTALPPPEQRAGVEFPEKIDKLPDQRLELQLREHSPRSQPNMSTY